MKSVFRRALCFALVIASVIPLCCSCSVRRAAVFTAAVNKSIQTVPTASGELHSTAKSNLSLVASSGLIQLYYDRATCSVAVYDTSADFYWTALPVYTGSSAAMLTATVLSEKGSYYLNSQDHSVAYSSYRAEFRSDGVKITFALSDNAATARKAFSSLEAGELYVCVPVDISLTDGSMNVSVDRNDILVSDGFILENITLLPDFGSLCYTDAAKAAEAAFYPGNAPAAEAEMADENAGVAESGEEETDAPSEVAEKNADAAENTDADFIFVPDGCGALLYTEREDASTERLSFQVYGDEELKDCDAACVPAFGIKKNGCAFVSVIGKGAETAVIKANRASSDVNLSNKVNAEFVMTAIMDRGDKIRYAPVSDEKISLCYRFMSGSEANYISMAASCREYLIRLGVLSARTVEQNALPVNISVVCSVDGGYRTNVSGFEETEDLLSVIKAKGVNEANLIVQGLFPGGLTQDSSGGASPLKKAGGKKAFNALCEYASKQKFNVFEGLNILTSGSSSDAALTLENRPVSASVKNPLYPYIGKDFYSVKFLAADRIEHNVIELMNSAKGLDISGFCINDAARYSYADRSQEGFFRAAVSAVIAENVSAFAIRNGLMLSGCNFNVIKDASYLIDIPFYTQHAETDAYCAVPFVPAILHSTVGYSGEAANVAAVPKLAMLKCVEYGGLPYFQWVFSMKSHLYYGLSLSDAMDFSVRAAKELADLSGARISGHKKIQSGVFATEYDTGSIVYVNYNNFSVSIGKITVPPYDYIRII